jgi:hypothetical protein
MTMALTNLPLEDREALAQLVAEHCRALEEGLIVLDRRVGSAKIGPIDLLAADAHGRLVVIDVTPQGGDQLLLEGLIHVGWLRRNHRQMADLMPEQKVDPALFPRLILVARDFSTPFREAIEGMGTPAIDLFRFRWLRAGSEEGLLLELVSTSWAKEASKLKTEVSLPALGEGIVPLAEEEIATFMEMNSRFTISQ